MDPSGPEAPIARPRRRLRPVTALTLAVMAPAVATGVAWLMWNEQGRLVPASWFLAAVMITCMAGGLAAGVVATVISAFLLNYVFTAPFFTDPYQSRRHHRGNSVPAEQSRIVLAVRAALPSAGGHCGRSCLKRPDRRFARQPSG